MSELKARPKRLEAGTGRFVIDGQFLREQATEAVVTFLTPFLGVYSATRGVSPTTVRMRKKRKKA